MSRITVTSKSKPDNLSAHDCLFAAAQHDQSLPINAGIRAMRRHGTSVTITASVLVVTVLVLFGFWTQTQPEGSAAHIVRSAVAALSSVLQTIVEEPKVLLTTPVTWMQEYFKHAPTLVLGLVALLLVPIVSAFFWILRAVHGWSGKGARIGGAPGQANVLQSGLNDSKSRHHGEDLYVPHHAVLEVAEGLGAGNIRRVRISRPVVQIGRSEDVDIKLNDAAVHRYHAAIERTDWSGYLIVDLSAGTGNGVVVNGQPTLNHPLHDGDEIRIGRTKLRFATITS